ncbi:MAG TPA: o-succinylbenzoate synthase [Candidatus Binataceae bacterium]|nr:o-succinylbenzoate synthase [Candidatus Binataceae bacterium]
MRIEAASIEPYRAALTRPLRTSRASLSVRAGFLLRLRTEGGLEGVGEAAPAYWLGGEQLLDTHASLKKISAAAAGLGSSTRLRQWAFGSDAVRRHLSKAALCALDCALLDLESRAAGISVAETLGGNAGAVMAGCALIGGDRPQAVAADARRMVRRGFRCLKLKLGVASTRADLARVQAVRGAVGDAVELRLDANRAWSFDQAQEVFAAIARLKIQFVEEPLRCAAPAELKRLRAGSGVAIALDESAIDRHVLEQYVREGAADVLVLKAARVGGLSAGIELARSARDLGLGVVVTDSIETEVGMSAALHLAAAIPAPHLAIGLGGSIWFGSEAAGRFTDAPAVLTLHGPGLG